MLPLRLLVLSLIASAPCAGCNSILGLGGFSVGYDAGTDAGKHDAPGKSCGDAVASGQCYPCAPETAPQYLNACTDAGCVPFDDTARIKNLPADGNLPPVPNVPDAGPG
jgi:hypothetical protein